MGDMPEMTRKLVKSIIRVVFNDRWLQYTEYLQLQGWSIIAQDTDFFI